MKINGLNKRHQRSQSLTFLGCDHRRTSVSQLLLQFLYLLLVLSEQGVLGVLVDLGLVLDLFGTVGVSQRAERLVIVVVGRRETRYHHRLGVAAQRVLPAGGRGREGREVFGQTKYGSRKRKCVETPASVDGYEFPNLWLRINTHTDVHLHKTLSYLSDSSPIGTGEKITSRKKVKRRGRRERGEERESEREKERWVRRRGRRGKVRGKGEEEGVRVVDRGRAKGEVTEVSRGRCPQNEGCSD